MHLVPGEIVDLNRQKSSQTDVQGHEGVFAQLLKKFGGEVQPGCRSRDGSPFPGKNGLIAFAVRRGIASLANVRRQRYVSILFQQPGRVPRLERRHTPLARALDVLSSRSEKKLRSLCQRPPFRRDASGDSAPPSTFMKPSPA